MWSIPLSLQIMKILKHKPGQRLLMKEQKEENKINNMQRLNVFNLDFLLRQDTDMSVCLLKTPVDPFLK